MNRQFYKMKQFRSFHLLRWIVLYGCLAAACKKVANHDEYLHTIYSVITDNNLYRPDGSFFHYSYVAAGKTLVPGDTMTIAGILGGPDAHREIRIGDSVVSTFQNAAYRIYNSSTKDTVWATVDYMKCRVPKGVRGNSIPVLVRVNGIAVNAPTIKVQEYTDIPSAADTTLVVDKMIEWLPSNLNLYTSGSSLIDLWKDGTVTGGGNIWFFNKPEGIFRIVDGEIRSVIKPGASITPVSGDPFQVLYIIGFTVDIDETVLYFSASTAENTPDQAKYYITRFCRMDIATGKTEVLNRSVFMKPASSYPRGADLSTPLYDPGANYLPAEGDIANTKLALVNLHIALDGTMYAKNAAYNTSTQPKSPLAGDPRFPQFSNPAYYAQRDSAAAYSWFGLGTGDISSGMDNFIRIRNGVVKSLAKPAANRPVPSLAIFSYLNQQLSTDGQFIYSMNTVNRTLNVISTADFEQVTKGIPGNTEFSFSSSDTSSITGLHKPSITPDQDRFSNYYVLSNGDAVFFPSSYSGFSLMGINFTLHNAYAFAGTEAGVEARYGSSVPGQNKTIGPAKWVDFSPNRRVLYGDNRFIGFDRKNNLYFASFAKQGFGAKHLPMEIYRIRKP